MMKTYLDIKNELFKALHTCELADELNSSIMPDEVEMLRRAIDDALKLLTTLESWSDIQQVIDEENKSRGIL